MSRDPDQRLYILFLALIFGGNRDMDGFIGTAIAAPTLLRGFRVDDDLYTLSYGIHKLCSEKAGLRPSEQTDGVTYYYMD
jgi:hypothetical protein